MYYLDLHNGAAIPPEGNNGVPLRSFKQRPDDECKTLEQIENRLIAMAKEDLNSSWEFGFAVGSGGVAAIWTRVDLYDRVGDATDLRLRYARSGYASDYYEQPGTALLSRSWDGRMSLREAGEWVRRAITLLQDTKPDYIALFDPASPRVVAAWQQLQDYGVLDLMVIGEHIA